MNNKPTTRTIVFIHGLFMNSYSWTDWVKFYENRGYKCYAPSYPYHDGDPADLRKVFNPQLGSLTFGQVLDSLKSFIDSLSENPILIGHSMGGLAVQKLIEINKGAAGVCISPAPPSGIMSFKWSFLKANISTVNPFKGNSVFLPDLRWFQYAFCNTMSMEQTKTEYSRYVVPESRNIARSSTGKDGRIDFAKAHKPLLIIAGEKDNIIPSSLVKKNFQAYKNKLSVIEFREFAGKTHFICGQKGWEDVAEHIDSWIGSLNR